MNDELSEALRGTLKTQAQRAPEPRHDLLDHVVRRHRARRRRGRVGAAAAAMLVVVGGSAVVSTAAGSGGGGARPAAGPAAGPLPTAAPAAPVPVGKLWPQAVRSIPNRLPNGRPFQPITMIDDDTLLVSTESSFEKSDRLLAYDLRARRTRTVTHIPTPSDATTFASDFTVGEGQVAWWLAYRRDGVVTTEIWAAPLAGGDARRVTAIASGKQEDVGLSRLAVGDGKIVWSMSQWAEDAPRGVFEAPLAGGEPRKIAGSDGFHLVAWPWIGSPAHDRAKPDAGQVVYRTLRDLRTGQTRTADVRKIAGLWSCGVTWCVGSTREGSYAQRRDGTGLRMLHGGGPGGGEWDLPLHDRFNFGMVRTDREAQPAWPVLEDLDTGKVADLGIRPGKDGTMSFMAGDDPADRLYVIREKGSFTLVDLARIS